MAQTASQYYSSKDNYGKYAYFSLKEILDDMAIDTLDPDHVLYNTRRSQMIKHAKAGIRILNREIKKTILAAEITIGPNLYIPLPQDYIDWVRVSVVMDDFRLKPLRNNTEIPTALGYLQDNDYEILFDNDGEILLADASSHFNKAYKRYEFCESEKVGVYGEFVIDERRGVIGFDQGLEDKEIVIEYISDGLQLLNLKDEEITVHKMLRDCLESYIFYNCIKGRRSISSVLKRAAKLEYKSNLHKAKLDRLDFDINALDGKIEYSPNFSQRRA